jgi:hypothetical protein
MENSEEGCASPTAVATDSEFAARVGVRVGGHSMPATRGGTMRWMRSWSFVQRYATWRSCEGVRG